MRALGVLMALFLAVGGASAQSLKPDSPYPLKAGINQGTADSFVGTHYWYYYLAPGNSQLTLRYKNPKTVLGAPVYTQLKVTVTDEARTWQSSKVVTSNRNESEASFFSEKLTKRQKVIVIVAPPDRTLVRMGGDYEIVATGDVAFDDVKSTGDPIVRTYDAKTAHYTEFYGATKFNADGTIITANGFTGTWQVFDRENRIYAVQLGGIRYSLQYAPGLGLVRPSDPTFIEFQELRR